MREHADSGFQEHISMTSNERRRVEVRRVDECDTLHDLFTHCFPAFGGAFLRRIYTILDHAVGMGCPMTLAISGPVTVSGQHQAWLIPLLETGWIAYLSTTDAVCYHDGHRSLDGRRNPIFETPIWGDDGALRDERTIRVTDMAFDEDVLLDQDRFLSAVLLRPEFQHKMTGTELRNRLGQFFAAQEKANGVQEGLLATCHRLAIPIFVGAPGDGSVFLNSMKLWAMKKAGLLAQDYLFDLDLHAEIYEACAEELQLAAGAGARPDPRDSERARLQFRRADRERAGDGWIVIVVSSGRGCDVGQGRQGHLSSIDREHAGGLFNGDAVHRCCAVGKSEAL
jgi:deoxyhypusine synthase